MTPQQSAGLVGSGPWAAMIHAPGLAAYEGLNFSHLWARNTDAANELAARFGLKVCTSYEQLLDSVDVVSFCVPPSVQVPLAKRARQQGKPVLLEKPLGASLLSARELEQAASPEASAAVVNYSLLLDDSLQAWVENDSGGWTSAQVVMTNGVLLSENPFSASPWRRAQNAELWDVGPHSISLLVAVFGNIAAVGAESKDGRIWMSCEHVSGRRTTAVSSLSDADERVSLEFTDADGRCDSPTPSFDAAGAYARAVRVLTTGAQSRCDRLVADLGFSTHVVAVLAAAAESLDRPGETVAVQESR